MITSSPEPTQDKTNVCQDVDLSAEDQQRLEDLHQYVLDGFITPETADTIYRDQISDPNRQEGQS
jgi:hypothetical protein